MSPTRMPESQGIELRGIAVSPGVAVGQAFRWNAEVELVSEHDLKAEEIDPELERFRVALEETRTQIHDIQEQVTHAIGVEGAQIFDAHILVVDDQVLLKEVIQRVREDCINVEYVLSQVADRYTQALEAVDDTYMRDRASDIRDVTCRILRNLAGDPSDSVEHTGQPCIVVARDLFPSETATLHMEKVIGIVTDLGSKTSHSAIMARAMEIPAVVGLRDLSTRIRPEDTLLIDGTNGVVIINPRQDQLDDYSKRDEHRRLVEARLEAGRDEPAETLDAYQVHLSANIEQASDVDGLIRHGAHGVGLFRTEYLYLSSTELPDEEKQATIYTTIAERLKPAPFVIRTLDLGGDKFSQHFKIHQAEMNPFMGWRAIRFCLDQPDLFKTQLRAILRASVHENVKIMYPMVSNAQEVEQANVLLEEAKSQLKNSGIPYQSDVDVGVMIEVPSAALTADLLAPHVQFFSLGTNDLVQYTLAVDRVNERVAHLYEPAHPAILKLIKNTLDVGRQHGVQVSVCGEMAANPMMALLLVGMGVDELSMSHPSIPLVKGVIRKATYGQVEALAEAALQCTRGEDILELCRELVTAVAPEVLDLLQ